MRYLEVQLTLVRSIPPLPHPPTSLARSPVLTPLDPAFLSPHPSCLPLNPHLTFPQPSPFCPIPPSLCLTAPFSYTPTHFFHYLSTPIIFQSVFHLPFSSPNPSSPSQPTRGPSELLTPTVYIHHFLILGSLSLLHSFASVFLHHLQRDIVISFHFHTSSMIFFILAQCYVTCCITVNFDSHSLLLISYFPLFPLHSVPLPAVFLPLLFDFLKGYSHGTSALLDVGEWKEKQEKGRGHLTKGRKSRSK